MGERNIGERIARFLPSLIFFFFSLIFHPNKKRNVLPRKLSQASRNITVETRCLTSDRSATRYSLPGAQGSMWPWG